MAESSLHDVALKTQSVGDNSPSDAHATTTDNQAIGGDAEEGTAIQENGYAVHEHTSLRVDDQVLDDGMARSDTNTSPANSVVGDSKSSDTKPIKKFVASKPVSFAKYSVPKTMTTNAPSKLVTEKTTTPTISSNSSTPMGRPRLVAKANSSSQQKISAYKPAAPDPMQVWNKNRAIPQPSTKHLTDEELKQQYGIHLTSRLQSDNDGKEAKWADIDDDEDDWAPETIEWNDGTKTTVNPSDTLPLKPESGAESAPEEVARLANGAKPPGPQYASTVGPNATVLKIGASVERQQAQRALAQQSKGPVEKAPMLTSKAAPAPLPAKSPWAKLPEIDKVPVIAINPQPSVPQPGRYMAVGPHTPVSTGAAPSPAKEISADDFNRSWRNSPSSQTKELFMPSSGRYETVPDGKRRMSKNEQNFRAPAVLQRPNQRDSRTPAEPSAAFQTNRTSVDQGRRRASSSISGGSGQFGRRMSFKSADTANISQADATVPPQSTSDEPAISTQIPATYQARGPDPGPGSTDAAADVDLEAQRAAQKALMRERIEKARQRKLEEEQKAEAEKQERIQKKLASLGPPPEPVKPKQQEEIVVPATESAAEAEPTPSPVMAIPAQVSSPPKPPQPLQTGEPQQYGMMKVHPLDSVKKSVPPPSTTQILDVPFDSEPHVPVQQAPVDKPKLPSPSANGTRPPLDSSRTGSEEVSISEPSPKLPKPAAALSADPRLGWGNTRADHRSQQTSNLWGLPNNKALGNGTFDQSLAGYSPRDLSRTSSTGQAWMNGRTPTMGQSPQLTNVTQHAPETRSHLLQTMTSPDPQPLSFNDEVEVTTPILRPTPIDRPQGPPLPPVPLAHNNVNIFPGHSQAGNIAAWNNFGTVARAQERAETEKLNREFNERREEEKRTGVRQQAPYNFQETFKQVQLGEQVGQRHVSNVASTSIGPTNMFGAVGSLPAVDVPLRMPNGQYGQLGRGSRFFPQQGINTFPPERRAVTYSHPEIRRTPSPPPAEEYSSLHPAFDGDFQRPKVHFPREKAIVRLPPASPPTPPPAEEPSPPPPPKAPLTWAARVSMPAPAPPPARAVSTPLVNNAIWQERFNGLLFPKQPLTARMPPAPAQAFSREPSDLLVSASAASVSLPTSHTEPNEAEEDEDREVISGPSSKNVEDEEDLFEDREAGSLPTVHLPRDTPPLQYHFTNTSRMLPAPIDPNSIHMFMVSNWSERHGYAKAQYAVVKAPGNTGKGIKRDLPVRNGNSTTQVRVRGSFSPKHSLRPKIGPKPRVPSKVH